MCCLKRKHSHANSVSPPCCYYKNQQHSKGWAAHPRPGSTIVSPLFFAQSSDYCRAPSKKKASAPKETPKKSITVIRLLGTITVFVRSITSIRSLRNWPRLFPLTGEVSRKKETFLQTRPLTGMAANANAKVERHRFRLRAVDSVASNIGAVKVTHRLPQQLS